MNKRSLYESIIRNVAKEVKKALNESEEELRNSDNEVIMECDNLFIGDMCYALDKGIYDKWCHEDFPAVVKHNGKVCALVGNTAYGDGTYYDRQGNSFPVDAGIISVVNLNFKNDDDLKSLDKCGLVIKVPSGKCKINFINDNGVFSIYIEDCYDGEVLYNNTIDTAEYEYEDEEERWEDDEWEDDETDELF